MFSTMCLSLGKNILWHLQLSQNELPLPHSATNIASNISRDSISDNNPVLWMHFILNHSIGTNNFRVTKHHIYNNVLNNKWNYYNWIYYTWTLNYIYYGSTLWKYDNLGTIYNISTLTYRDKFKRDYSSTSASANSRK